MSPALSAWDTAELRGSLIEILSLRGSHGERINVGAAPPP